MAKANVESAWCRKEILRGQKAVVGYAIEERVASVAKTSCLPFCIKNEESLELYHFLCSSISFHKKGKMNLAVNESATEESRIVRV